MASDNSDLSTIQQESECLEREKCVAELINDGEVRELMIQRLKDSGDMASPLNKWNRIVYVSFTDRRFC